MSTSIKKRVSFILLLLYATTVKAQTGVLDNYIQEGFKNNDGISQQKVQLDKAMYALREAHSLFLPNVSLQGSYTKADGGRTIDLPVGHLLNNVYTTLNTLTAGNRFPNIKNESVMLNPDNYYDAKFRTSLPLINAEIYYNKQLRKVQITQQQATVNVYKRELVKSIKNAYYQYYQAGKATEIYRNALTLVNENIRINQSLLNNGVRNSTALTRSQTEKEKIEASITQAENNSRNAQSYFNFLLNKPLDAAITVDSSLFEGQEPTAITSAKGSSEREELAQLRSGIMAYELNTKMTRSYIIPKLNTFLDLGSQGFNWQYNNNTQYYIWGVNLQWDLFAAGRNKYKAVQAADDVKVTQLQYDNTEKALQLALAQSLNNYNTAEANYRSARTQLNLAEKYYRDQLKIYKEGQLLYIELLDAFNQLMNAQLQLSVSRANLQSALAEIERNEASYPIN